MTVEQAIRLLSKQDPKAKLVIDPEACRLNPLGVAILYRDGEFLHEPGELTASERAELEQVVAFYG
jgi:hypothetical protein